MCVCLSLSQEIPGLRVHPAPSLYTSRHRRSVSDSLLVTNLSLGCDISHVHYKTLDDPLPWSSRNNLACKIFYLPDTSSTSSTIAIASVPHIPIPPPLPGTRASYFIPTPPPLPLQTKKFKSKIHSGTTLHDEIARYNFYDQTSYSPSSSSSSSSSTSQTPVTCSVCFEDALPKDFLLYMPCMHKFCRDCVREHIKILVSTGKKLTCLNANCKSIMPVSQVRELMDERTYERYMTILRTPAGAHRWCPRAGCDTPYIKADCDSSSPKVICKNGDCNLTFCYDCRVKWHDGATCEEFKELQNKDKPEEEVLSEEYAKQNLQECPNCSIWVEKIDGCEYVMCAACNHEFCWDCLEPHDHNMGAHVHGPRYKPSFQYRHQIRQRRAVKVAKIAGITVAAVVLGPPALALGAAVAVVVLPIMGIHQLHKITKRKRAIKAAKKRAALHL